MWEFNEEKLTITFDSQKFKHTYYAPNQEVFKKKVEQIKNMETKK